MKKILVILLLSPLLLFGQTDAPPSLYEVIYLKVKQGQEKAFEAAVKKHNLAFHKKGTAYHAALFYNINGPHAGHYSWIMGPTNFTAMDTRPGEGAHDEDWKNVGQYTEATDGPTYWKEDSKLSFEGTESGNGKSMIWIYDLKTGQEKNFASLVAQVKEVYKAKRPNESIFIYWNEFSDTKAGQDAAVVFPFKKWAWLDRDSNFRAQFESVHGPNSYEFFLSEFSDCVDGRVDFIRERIE